MKSKGSTLTLMFFQRLSVVSTIVLQIGPNSTLLRVYGTQNHNETLVLLSYATYHPFYFIPENATYGGECPPNVYMDLCPFDSKLMSVNMISFTDKPKPNPIYRHIRFL